MLRRTLLALLAVAVVTSATPPAGAGTQAYRPDAFLKLCGVNSGCKIDPLPHPWVGNNIYNTTGFHQRVHERLDNGRGIRFWIAFQNDGTQPDTYALHGCNGNKNFQILAVLVGKYKWPIGVAAEHIEDAFINDTWTTTLDPGERVVITLNILTYDPSDSGMSYDCRMTITSQGDPTLQDTVVASMTMY